MEFISSIPERLFAALAGIIVLPGRTLLYLNKAINLPLGIAVLLFFAVPGFFAYLLEELEVPRFFNALIVILAVIPLTVAILLPVLALVTLYLIGHAVIDFFKNVWIGLTAGLVDGLDGFWKAYEEQTSPFEDMLVRLGVSMLGTSYEPEPYVDGDLAGFRQYDAQGFERILTDLQDVVVPGRELDVPDLNAERAPSVFQPLTEAEKATAKKIDADFKAWQNPLSEAAKNKLDLLKLRIEQVTELSATVEKVKQAFIINDKSNLVDELCGCEIRYPILLVKQYLTDNNVWRSVPATSKLGDKENLTSWLTRNPTHPTFRENIANPPLHEGKPTRFKWNELTANNCQSYELEDSVGEIRDLMQELTLELQNAPAARNVASVPPVMPAPSAPSVASNAPAAVVNTNNPVPPASDYYVGFFGNAGNPVATTDNAAQRPAL